MNTVIIICNDPRIALVKEAIQPLLMAKIAIIPDFDIGLKEVFDKRPLVVLFQDEIAGVKGETVTRHIRSLLQENSPQFIHLDHAASGPGIIRDFSDGINLDLPVEELIAVFREHLQHVSGIRWKEQIPKPVESGTPSRPPQAATHPDEVFPVDHSRDAPVPTPKAYAKEDEVFSIFPEFSPFPEAVLPSPPVPVPLSETADSSRQQPPASLSEKAPEPPARLSEPASDTAGMSGADSEVVPFPVESNAPTSLSRVPLVIVGGVLVALVCGVLLYMFFSAGPKPQNGAVTPKQQISVPTPAAPAKQPAPTGVTLRERLPSFIPKEGLDPTYGAARPGWERYVSPRLEYLIFRENGAIRALQVIALQKESIDAPFISSALRELCGDATCMIRTRSSRDGYLIEQGQTSTKAEVIFYKKKGTGETRGVVISLP